VTDAYLLGLAIHNKKKVFTMDRAARTPSSDQSTVVRPEGPSQSFWGTNRTSYLLTRRMPYLLTSRTPHLRTAKNGTEALLSNPESAFILLA
jgi:hypothetical protein